MVIARNGYNSVLVLYSCSDEVRYGKAQDIITDQETPQTAEAIAQGLRSLGWRVTTAPVRAIQDVGIALDGYRPERTVVFNQCETIGGHSSSEPLAAREIEARGFLYTGGDEANLALCLNKDATKRCLRAAGVATAESIVVESVDALHRHIANAGGASRALPLPAIVKPVAEDCSLGLGPDSVVRDLSALEEQVAHVTRLYRQPALVERFLSGREFTAALWGPVPEVLHEDLALVAVSEVDYSSHRADELAFDHFDAKWSNRFPALYPAPIDEGYRAWIGEVARAAARATGCRNYARVDMREHDNELFVMEVNPNPGLSPDAGFARGAGLLGYDYAGMVNRIVELAIARAVRGGVRRGGHVEWVHPTPL